MVLSESKPRDRRLDVAKGLLITIVVAGHFLEATNHWSANSARLPLTYIYSFHMPAFVFLTGVTAKPNRLLKRVGPLLVLLAIFQTAYFLANQWLGNDADFTWNTPYWMLWYLLALVWWQLLTPALARFPRASVAVSILAAITMTALPTVGYAYSASRALTFLPFFVVGFLYGKRILAWCSEATGAVRAGVLVAALALPGLLYVMHIDNGWLYGSMGSEKLDTSAPDGLLIRASLMAIACVVTAAFLMLLPLRASVSWDSVGRHSLPVYLLHGFVVLAADPYLPKILADNNLMSLGVVAVLTAGTVVITSWPPIDAVLRKVSAFAFSPRFPRPAEPLPASGEDAVSRPLAELPRA